MPEGRIDIPEEAKCPVRVIKWGKPAGDEGDLSQLVTVKLHDDVDYGAMDEPTMGTDANGAVIVQFKVPGFVPDPSDALLAMMTAKLADAIDSLPAAGEGKVEAEVKGAGALLLKDTALDRYFVVQVAIAPQQWAPSHDEGEQS